MFELHPQLAADCVEICNLPLCRVLLMNDSQYPWLILVPQRENIKEIYELTQTEQNTLWQEASVCGKKLMKHFDGDKLNIATLGNMVPQLHIHVIVRKTSDSAWPKPVWGVKPSIGYKAAELSKLSSTLRSLLTG